MKKVTDLQNTIDSMKSGLTADGKDLISIKINIFLKLLSNKMKLIIKDKGDVYNVKLQIYKIYAK